MKKQTAFYLLLVTLSLFLQACAPGAVRMLPQLKADSALEPGYGVVALRLADAAPRTSYPFNYVTLAPKEVYSSQSIKFLRLTRDDEGAVDDGTFIASVPAGKYSLSSIHYFYQFGDYYYSYWVSSSPTFGTFTVKPNQLTNLGTVIYYPRYDGKNFFKTLTRNDSFKDADAVVQRKYPAVYAQLLNKQAPAGWDDDEYSDERRSHYVRIAQNPLSLVPAAFHADGTTTYTGRLGTLPQRDAKGNWTLDAVDGDIGLTAYVENGHGTKAVAGEFGSLYFKRAGTVDWIKMQAPEPGALPAHLYLDDNDQLYVFSQGERRLRVYVGALGDKATWKHLRTFDRKFHWQTPAEEAAYAAKLAEQSKVYPRTQQLDKIGEWHFITLEKTVFMLSDSLRYAIDPGAGRYESTTRDFPSPAIEYMGGNNLIGTENSMWLNTVSVHYSTDMGQSWTKLQRKGFRICHVPRLKEKYAIYCERSKKFRLRVKYIGMPLLVDKNTFF